MFPRIIHQTWKTEQVPPEFSAYVQSWKTAHPEWQYMLWTDEDNRLFIKEYFGWFLSTYDSYTYKIQRVDAVRYFILYHFGGLYVDLDFECHKNFDELVAKHPCILGKEPYVHAKTVYGVPFVVSNALMGSTMEHPLWLETFKLLQERARDPRLRKNVLWSTGPGLLTDSLSRLVQNPQSRVFVTEPEWFFPKPAHQYQTVNSRRKSVKPWATHHWANTWTTKKPK